MKRIKKILWTMTVLVLVAQTIVPPSVSSQDAHPVVVIDPGHGRWSNSAGKIDPGAASGDLIEKDLTLDVAFQVRDLLARCSVDTFLTREGDDSGHILSDVDEIVNGHNPTVGVARAGLVQRGPRHGTPSGDTMTLKASAWPRYWREMLPQTFRSLTVVPNQKQAAGMAASTFTGGTPHRR